MKHSGDITKIRGCIIPPVDVAVGGSPCQDLSIAGKRTGLDGERSGLFMEQIRIIKELRYADSLRGGTAQFVRPRFMVWENVAGAFSSTGEEDFRVVLEETARIVQRDAVIPGPPGGKWRTNGRIMGNGWSIAWRVLDAQFWGVPQRRRRIALVADFGGHAAPEILFVRKSVSGDIDQGAAARERPSARAEGGAGRTVENCLTPWDAQSARVYSDEGVWHSLNANENGGQSRDAVLVAGFMGGQGAKAGSIAYHEELAPTLKSADSGGNRIPCVFENHAQDSRFKGPVEISQTVSATFGMGGNNTPLVMATGQGGAEIMEDRSPTLNCNHEAPIVCGTFQNTGHGYWKQSPIGATIRTPQGSGSLEANLVTAIDCRNCTEHEEISPTLQAHEGGGYSLNATHPISKGKTVRRLTPLECERLQGYPDGWTDIGPWVDSKGKVQKNPAIAPGTRPWEIPLPFLHGRGS